MRGIDAVLVPFRETFDIQIAADGDIDTEDSFDTAITIALLTDRRADPSEVLLSERRRGWIGNEHTPGFEIGSKLWLFEMARLTATVVAEFEAEVVQALSTLVDEGLAEAIRSADLEVTTNGVRLTVSIQRDHSRAEKRYFKFWDKTGV